MVRVVQAFVGIVLIAAASVCNGGTGDDQPTANLNALRHCLEHADVVVVFDTREGGAVDTWTLKGEKPNFPRSPTFSERTNALTGGRKGWHLFIESWQKPDNNNFDCGQVFGSTSISISIPMVDGQLKLLDGTRVPVWKLPSLVEYSKK